MVNPPPLEESLKRMESVIKKISNGNLEDLSANLWQNIENAKQDSMTRSVALVFEQLFNGLKNGFSESVTRQHEFLKKQQEENIKPASHQIVFPNDKIKNFFEWLQDICFHTDVLIEREQVANKELAKIDIEYFAETLQSILRPLLDESTFGQLQTDLQNKKKRLNALKESADNDYSYYLYETAKFLSTWLHVFLLCGQTYAKYLLPNCYELQRQEFEKRVQYLSAKNMYCAKLHVPLPSFKEVKNNETNTTFFALLKNVSADLIGVVLPPEEMPPSGVVDTKSDIMHDIEENEPTSARDIAKRLKLSVRTINTQTRSLKNKGLISERKRGRNVLYSTKSFDWKAWEKEHGK